MEREKESKREREREKEERKREIESVPAIPNRIGTQDAVLSNTLAPTTTLMVKSGSEVKITVNSSI
jgi:hypothetical protein